MAQALDKITIKGFKSIRALENFELTNLGTIKVALQDGGI